MYIYIDPIIYNDDTRGKEFSNGNSSSQLCSSLQKDGNREGSEGGREGGIVRLRVQDLMV